MLSNHKIEISQLFTLTIGVIVLFLASDPAFAQEVGEGGDLETVLCNALSIVQGSVGKSIAAFAIIFIGVSLFLGKVSWGVAIATALGIGAIFGASSIVEGLGGGTEACTVETLGQ